MPNSYIRSLLPSIQNVNVTNYLLEGMMFNISFESNAYFFLISYGNGLFQKKFTYKKSVNLKILKKAGSFSILGIGPIFFTFHKETLPLDLVNDIKLKPVRITEEGRMIPNSKVEEKGITALTYQLPKGLQLKNRVVQKSIAVVLNKKNYPRLTPAIGIRNAIKGLKKGPMITGNNLYFKFNYNFKPINYGNKRKQS